MATETLSFDILARDLASATFRNVGREAAGAAGGVKDLSSKLKDVSGRVAEARVGVQGDKEMSQTLDKLTLQMIRMSKRKIDPELDLEGFLRFRSQLTGIELALDKLDHRRVTATVDVRVNRGGLRGLLSGLAGGGLEPGGAGGGLGGLIGPAAIGGGLIGAGLVPGAVGLGIGGAAGLGLVGGGLFGAAQGTKRLKADQASINQITTALKTAVGNQKIILSAALKDANKQLAKDAAFFAPFDQFKKALSGLTQTLLTPLRSVMAPLAGIFSQFGKSVAGLSPQFTALFRGSLPFIKQFLGFMLQAGKILLPAFTQAMQQMVKSGALSQMTQALVVLTQGLATFIVNLGPGMKASAEIFARLATFIGRTLGFLGDAFTVIAKVLTFDFPGAAKKGTHAVIASFDAFRHAMSASFAVLRHDIAAAWDRIWQDTIGKAIRGIADVVRWFRGVTPRVLAALFGFGHSLYAFAHSAFTEFWDAIKSVGGDIWNWLTSWVKRLPGWLKHLLGIKSPSSVFYDIGRQMMLGLFHGIQDHAHHAANAAKSSASAAVGALGGPTSASAYQAQQYAASRLGAYGWGRTQFGPLLALWNQESGWNRFARNPSSGAYGIPQALPPGKMGAAANPPLSSAAAQINWGLSYILGTYGSPAGAWAHEQSFNWYGSGLHGWVNSPTLIGVGERGRERVDITPAGRGAGGGNVVLEIHSGGTRLDDAIVEIIRQAVKVRGGGNVQVALGRRGA